MIPAAIIATKRDHRELSDAEIAFFVQGYSCGEIPDYQMSAMAMAIFLNGMTERETAALTLEMLNSGVRIEWPDDGIVRVDKHSTGGLGDKTSIILAPLLAEFGLQVPMLSGRGLGATGGTLDKLEAIRGFRTDLTLQEIVQLTQSVGCVITGASAELAPADRRLYALRDVTATVPSIPLITASIMSKKLAESPDALVLDVKFGSGAFMKTFDQAAELAASLVGTGQRMGVRTSALLTDMNQPLGRMCGNALEVRESVEILRGAGPADAREVTIALAVEVLLLAGAGFSAEQARQQIDSILSSGRAWERFCKMVRAQGGDPEAPLRIAPSTEVKATKAGYVCGINTEQLGMAIITLGGGRKRMGELIDHSVGLEMLIRIGDPVSPGDPLLKIFSEKPEMVREAVLSAIHIEENRPERLPQLIVKHSSSAADGV